MPAAGARLERVGLDPRREAVVYTGGPEPRLWRVGVAETRRPSGSTRHAAARETRSGWRRPTARTRPASPTGRDSGRARRAGRRTAGGSPSIRSGTTASGTSGRSTPAAGRLNASRRNRPTTAFPQGARRFWLCHCQEERSDQLLTACVPMATPSVQRASTTWPAGATRSPCPSPCWIQRPDVTGSWARWSVLDRDSRSPPTGRRSSTRSPWARAATWC